MPAPTGPSKYSKWDAIEDSDEDPEPENPFATEEGFLRQRAAESARASGTGSSAKKSKAKKKQPTSATAEWDAAQKKKGAKPTNINQKSAYIATFAGESGRFILLRLQPRFSPVMGPEDAALIKAALRKVTRNPPLLVIYKHVFTDYL